MQQPSLWAADVTVPTPHWLCLYDHCTTHGRAVKGAPVDSDTCINVRVRCVTCGRSGVESTRKDLA